MEVHLFKAASLIWLSVSVPKSQSLAAFLKRVTLLFVAFQHLATTGGASFIIFAFTIAKEPFLTVSNLQYDSGKTKSLKSFRR